MRILLTLSFSLFFSLSFSQSANEANAVVNEQRYRSQLSNEAYEKAITEMRRNANESSTVKLKQLDELFELNFAQNDRFQSKLKSLNEKKKGFESKIVTTKSAEQKESLQKKIADVNSEINKLNEKIKANESELAFLQEAYRKQMK
ncbi:hypothetical protein [Kaistella sp.]|uniref:hypothetical protein n=1 Tax=Kaistella sp. TaxID=2782235 RepID=UPI002F94C91F